MKKLFLLPCIIACIALFACNKSATKTKTTDTPIVYNYTYYTYVGNTEAHYVDIVNSVTTTWDSLYSDTLKVAVDSSKDRVVFTVNEHNPLGIYPQFDYDFLISSNFYRKTFIQNYYQSFFYEGDTLKSYFFKLQVGSGVSYQKEIKFSGYKIP
jgi:hypothetical protein